MEPLEPLEPQEPLPNNLPPRSVNMVWLLNLFPFFGLGYLYAVGPSGLKVMCFAWIFEMLVGRWSFVSMVWLYLILSVLGTAQLIQQQRSGKPDWQKKMLENSSGLDQRVRGIVAHSDDHDEDTAPKLADRLKKKKGPAALPWDDEDEDHSDVATDLFEHKVRAAEKTLKARAAVDEQFDPDPPINFAPSDAPKFSDEVPQSNASDANANNSWAPSAVPDATTSGAAGSVQSTTTSPYGSDLPSVGDIKFAEPVVPDLSSFVVNSDSNIPDVTSQYSTESSALPEVPSLSSGPLAGTAGSSSQNGSSITSTSDVGIRRVSSASFGSTTPAKGSAAAATGSAVSANTGTGSGSPPTKKTSQKGLSVPDIASQWDSKDVGVPEVSTQWDSKDVSVPEVATQWDSKDVSVPEVATQWDSKDVSVPEVATQWDSKDVSVPDVATLWTNQDISAPEVSTQWDNKNVSVPDVGSQWDNKNASVPDVSTQWDNKDVSVPDVGSQWDNKNANVPDVSTQWDNKDVSVPDVGSQWDNKNVSVPDVSTQWDKRDINVPDLPTVGLSSTDPTAGSPVVAPSSAASSSSASASSSSSSSSSAASSASPAASSGQSTTSAANGNFDAPQFSFSFEDHLNSGSSNFTFGAPAGAEPHCPKCGAAVDSNFSFCLACGQAFV